MRSLFIAVYCVFILVGCESLSIQKLSIEKGDELSVDIAADGASGPVPERQKVKKFKRGNKSPYVVFGKTYEVLPTSLHYREIGIASWYGKKFHGRLTSNGEVYDMYKVSAAHKSLPLPTTVKVTNLDNGKSVVIRVNDRGPFHDDRVIDLSYQAALQLGFADKGTAPVVVEALTEVNHPDVTQSTDTGPSFYLQVGAFSQRSGAEQLQNEIERLFTAHQMANIDVRILQSELTTQLLHKVWLGPIRDEGKRDQVSLWVQQAELGKPIRVEVN